MSDNPSWNDQALEEFVRRLDAYRKECGRPALRELVRLSRQVVEAEHGGKRYRNLPELSLTALSDVLNRRRKTPPSWNWVACFLLSCERFAAGTPGLEPPPDTLEDWRRMWEAVYSSTGIIPEIDLPPPEPAGPEEPAGPSLSEQRFFAKYGRHGGWLLRCAEIDRDPDAAYRLGLLLWLDDAPAGSAVWLARAKDDGHRGARELVDDPEPMSMVAHRVFELGRAAAAAGCDDAADLYYERAARRGHARSAFEFALRWMERDQVSAALPWFGWAARCGHPLAKDMAEQLRRDIPVRRRSA